MRTLRSATLALVVLLAACSGGGRRITPLPPAGRQAESAALPVLVRVTNHNWMVVDVFVVSHGQTQRLGQIETGRTSVFTLPVGASAAGEIQLVVDPVGSGGQYATGGIAIFPGTLVALQVENQLGLSTFSVDGSDQPGTKP